MGGVGEGWKKGGLGRGDRGGRGRRKEWGGKGEYASLTLGGWTPLTFFNCAGKTTQRSKINLSRQTIPYRLSLYPRAMHTGNL